MFLKKLFLRSTLVIALVGGLAVCGIDGPAAPAVPNAPPDASLLGDIGGVVDNVLSPLSCKTTGYGSVTKTIGTGGGAITVGPHRLVIPPGALSQNVAITATAPRGNEIFVDLQPHGLRFAKSGALTLSYKECGILVLDPKVVYVDDQRNLLEVLFTVPNLLNKTATGEVKHFSGYMLWD